MGIDLKIAANTAKRVENYDTYAFGHGKTGTGLWCMNRTCPRSF